MIMKADLNPTSMPDHSATMIQESHTHTHTVHIDLVHKKDACYIVARPFQVGGTEN